MANELRKYQNHLGGLIEDNPLTSGATTLTSAGLGAMNIVDSTEHMALVLDPDGLGGAPEIAWVTAHTAAGSTATILRAQEGTVARTHLRDVPWVHAATTTDVRPASRSASVYRSTNQTGLVDSTWTIIDYDTEWWDDFGAFDLATNLFTAPAAGRIRVEACAEFVGSGLSAAYLRVSKNAGTIIVYDGGHTPSPTIVTPRLTLTSGWRPCGAADTFAVQTFVDVTSGTGTINCDANGITAASFEFVAD